MDGNTARRNKVLTAGEKVYNGVERILNCCPIALVPNNSTATEYRDCSANVDGGGGEELSIVYEDEEGPFDADAADPVPSVFVARRSRSTRSHEPQ